MSRGCDDRPGQTVVIDDGIAYVSGMSPLMVVSRVRGTVGADVGVELAAQEARKAAANLLHRLVRECGSLDAVERILKLTVFVSSTADFTDQPAVANGASQLCCCTATAPAMPCRVSLNVIPTWFGISSRPEVKFIQRGEFSLLLLHDEHPVVPDFDER